MKRLLVLFCLILCPVVLMAQQPGRPRRVTTKPANPCNERDFIQAVDTKVTSICQNAQWKDLATTSASPFSAQLANTVYAGPALYPGVLQQETAGVVGTISGCGGVSDYIVVVLQQRA
jgi:hypothetical protein